MKTSVQKKKSKLSTISKVCFGCEFLSIALPFIVIGIVNYNKYFVEYNGVKMTLACILAVALMFFAIWLTAKKKFEGSYITLVLGWATMTIIFFLIGAVILDIAVIMLFGLIGLIGAYVLDCVSKSYEEKANEIQEAVKQAKKDKMVAQYKRETESEDLLD